MLKSAQVREFAKANGIEVVDVRLPETLPLTSVLGVPRVDVKTLIEMARRRYAHEQLLGAE